MQQSSMFRYKLSAWQINFTLYASITKILKITLRTLNIINFTQSNILKIQYMQYKEANDEIRTAI